MKKKRITKKTAETVFKKFIGTSKGIKNLSDHVRDMWMIEQGMIKAYCCYEAVYSAFGIRRDAEHIRLSIAIEGVADQTLYLDPKTMETDDMYTLEQELRKKKENIKAYLDEQGLVPVNMCEAKEANLEAVSL